MQSILKYKSLFQIKPLTNLQNSLTIQESYIKLATGKNKLVVSYATAGSTDHEESPATIEQGMWVTPTRGNSRDRQQRTDRRWRIYTHR